MPSNISGRSNTTVYVNTVSCDLPLNLITNNSSSTTINLGGLNSFGNDNQILRMNGTNAIEWSDETIPVIPVLTTSTDFGTNAGSTVSLGKINIDNRLFGILNYKIPATQQTAIFYYIMLVV